MRLLTTGGLRLLIVVVDETLVLGTFYGVTDTLVEAGVDELGTTDETDRAV